jgi:dTDP-glucose 4,6-dehydratase
MTWQGKRVLVTGAGGFIASHLVERLVGMGAKVRAFARYNSRGDLGTLQWLEADTFKQVEVVAGDLRDASAIRQAARDVEIIFHLGALIAIPYSYVHPREVIETNILGTLNVLEAAREFHVAKVVHTSTSEVYGTAITVPISESHPLQGQSPYSASKIGADKIAESFYRAFQVPVATIRPFNTYGPRQSARAVIPTIITQALTRDTIKLGSLHPTRDFTFVKDTAEGFMLVAESPNTIGQELNVGSDAEISIQALAQKIIALIGRPVEIVTDEQRLRPSKSEVERLWADNRKAKELIGWTPRTSLDDGLRQTIEWITRNIGRYRPNEYTI